MAREVVTADSDDPIEQAANTMRERRIGSLPVSIAVSLSASSPPRT
jgi:CBS domain-containing protein